jgi:Zn-dependent protease
MKGSFRIVTLFGIPVHLHWTFFLVFVYIYFLGSFSASAPKLTVSYMILILMLFVCVLMHEFGHALMARRFGVSTQDIILSPIGGIARLSKLPEKPIQEFLVAIAGPAVNFAIAIALAPIYYWTLSAVDRSNLIYSVFNASGNYFAPDLSMGGFLIVGLFWLNIVLALFNLLPAFPMDGGRVLRALLSLKLSRVRATRYAAFIGKAFAIVFVGIGFFSQPMNLLYVFIGVFIFMTAASEYRMVRIEKLMNAFTGAALFSTPTVFLFGGDSVDKAAELIESTDVKSILILDQWQNPQGILTAKVILDALKQGQAEQAIRTLALEPIQMVTEQWSLGQIYQYMNDQKYDALVACDRLGNIKGVIDPYMLNTFIKKHQKAVV